MAEEPSSSEEHEPFSPSNNGSDKLQINIEPVDDDEHDEDHEILQSITNDIISDADNTSDNNVHHTDIDDEVQNLIPDEMNSENISQSDEYVDVMTDINNTNNNDTNTDNEYVVINVSSDDNDTKQIDEEVDKSKEESTHSDDDDIDDEKERQQNEISYSSEPQPSTEQKTKKIVKAHVMVTWVPTNTTAAELTVIAGSTVSVIHSEPIRKQIFDNPLALKNTPSGEFDKIISINSMHFTKVQLRNGKIGIVPSNILRYDENPISNIWTKVKVQHSYMAKEENELTISTQERLQIYGIVQEDGMITAKRKKFRICSPVSPITHLPNIQWL